MQRRREAGQPEQDDPMTRFGEFDDAAREYVISRPDTPLPWINYLGNEDYFGIISNTAGGYSFVRDARLRRLTRYRYNNVPTDVGGRYLYVRDAASGDFWSPSWQPTRVDVEHYRCRHGLGYTVIGSRRAGIDVETLYFVPIGETLEIWRSRVTNGRDTPAQLSLFSAVEFCLWDALDDATNLQRNLSIGEVEVDGGVIYHTTEYRERRNHFAYFACSAEIAGFDTDRDQFLGPYRGWDRPAVVERGRSGDSIARGWAPCGSHHVELNLDPGETRRDHLPARVHREPDRLQVRPARIAADRQEPGQRRDRPLPALGRGRRGLRRAGRTLVGSRRRAADIDPERARRPHDQCLEPLPVHGHLQPVPFGVAVRDGSRPRHGVSRLESGPPRFRPHGSRPSSPAHSRHRGHPTTVRRRLPPVPAADQARQRRDRIRVQRRSALADPRRRRLSEGDRRRLDPRRAGSVRQRAGVRSRPCTSTCSARWPTRSIGSVRTGSR